MDYSCVFEVIRDTAFASTQVLLGVHTYVMITSDVMDLDIVAHEISLASFFYEDANIREDNYILSKYEIAGWLQQYGKDKLFELI